MTLRIIRRDEQRRIAPRRILTFRMTILWMLTVALVLVVVSHAQSDSVDAATELRHDHEPMQTPVGGGELEPDLFCEAPSISGGHTMAEVWDAEMRNAIGRGSVMPASVINSEPETVWPANVTVGMASD